MRLAVWTFPGISASFFNASVNGAMIVVFLVTAEQVTKMQLTKENDMIRQSRRMEPMSLSAIHFVE
jgi:hypothetical protein